MITRKAKRSPTPPPTADPLAVRVLRTIQRHAMLDTGDSVLVGVSGGPDSMALAHLLRTLAARWDLRLGVAHLDHGLRPEAAEREAALVEALARHLGMACHKAKIESLPASGSLEERLRLQRYAFFHEVAAAHGYNKIALGHHADDNAEAVLLHLLRGSGIRGLAGIPPMRAPGIVRPLIAVRRAEILAYLERHGIAYALDPSNADLGFERNRVRHELLPLLSATFNPNLIQVLNRTAMLCWEEERWLEAHLKTSMSQAIGAVDAEHLDLRVPVMASWPRPMQRRILRMALRQWQGHLRRLGAEHIEALIGLLVPGKAGRLHLPVKLIAERCNDTLRFHHEAQPRGSRPHDLPRPYRYDLPWPLDLPLSLEIPEADCRLHFSMASVPEPRALRTLTPQAILLDPAQLNSPLCVRSFRPGDRLRPFGLDGSQKLKALFANRKIPRRQRHRIPLLLCGDDILWVVGLRRAAAAPVSPSLYQALRVRVEALEAGSPSIASLL